MTAPIKPFKKRIREHVMEKHAGRIRGAAIEAGVENSTMWRYLNEPSRKPDLRTFALLCTWAGIDANEAIVEFTK